MQIRIERLVLSVDFLQTRFSERAFQLAVDHGNACFERFHGIAFGVVGRRQCHVEIVQGRDQFFEQRRIGEAGRLLAFARGPLLEVFQICGRSQQPLPMLVCLGGFGLQFFNLVWRQPGHGRVGRLRPGLVRLRCRGFVPRFQFLRVRPIRGFRLLRTHC